MKSLLVALCVAIAGVSLSAVPLSAEAKRLGGGRPAGMQRDMAPKQPDAPVQQRQAPAAGQQAAPAAAPAAAAAGKRSWMGPIAGLAAGLGIAALMSHLGLSEAFGNFLMMALLAVAVLVAIRWFMSRRSGSTRATGAAPGWQLGTAAAGAGSSALSATPAPRDNAALPPLQPMMRTAEAVTPFSQLQERPTHSAPVLPQGVDAASFERLAKMVFIRLQAANDTGAVEDLRKFTTPELFASLRLDLQERGQTEQHTDVVELDAQLVDAAQEGDQWVASVRFRGLIREERGGDAVPFDELWHLVKPTSGTGEWAIAGITPQG